jgi:hypothetical protein
LPGRGAARRRFELTDCGRQGDDHHSLRHTPSLGQSGVHLYIDREIICAVHLNACATFFFQ